MVGIAVDRQISRDLAGNGDVFAAEHLGKFIRRAVEYLAEIDRRNVDVVLDLLQTVEREQFVDQSGNALCLGGDVFDPLALAVLIGEHLGIGGNDRHRRFELVARVGDELLLHAAVFLKRTDDALGHKAEYDRDQRDKRRRDNAHDSQQRFFRCDLHADVEKYHHGLVLGNTVTVVVVEAGIAAVMQHLFGRFCRIVYVDGNDVGKVEVVHLAVLEKDNEITVAVGGFLREMIKIDQFFFLRRSVAVNDRKITLVLDQNLGDDVGGVIVASHHPKAGDGDGKHKYKGH